MEELGRKLSEMMLANNSNTPKATMDHMESAINEQP